MTAKKKQKSLTYSRLLAQCALSLTSAGFLSPCALSAESQIAGFTPIQGSLRSADAQSFGNTFTPQSIRKAYGIDQIPHQGAGRTIAIVTAYGNPLGLYNDLEVFNRAFSLPSADLRVTYVDNRVPSDFVAIWGLETNLDVQWAHAIAPLATIHLYVAQSSEDPDMMRALDLATESGADIISMSWGTYEIADDPRTQEGFHQHFKNKNPILIAASGDWGTKLIWPAVFPEVIAVGGTQLYIDAQGERSSEEAWSGSGGGMSAHVLRPGFQSKLRFEGQNRVVPDIAYNANPATGFPVYDSQLGSDSGWVIAGGTSAGAPQWAAIFALMIEGRAALSSPSTEIDPHRSPQPSNEASGEASGCGRDFLKWIYHLPDHLRSGPSRAFRDIRRGSNSSFGSPGYNARRSFDWVTGWGSPRAFELWQAWTNCR